MSWLRCLAARLGKAIVGLPVLAIAVTACDNSLTHWFESFAPTAEVDFAKQTLALFQSKNFDAIEARANPSIVDAQFRSKIEEIARLFPQEEPGSIKIISWHKIVQNGESRLGLGLEYQFPDAWLLAGVTISDSAGKFQILGVHVTLSKTSIEESNRFTLQNKSPLHYAVLGLTIFHSASYRRDIRPVYQNAYPEAKVVMVDLHRAGHRAAAYQLDDGSMGV